MLGKICISIIFSTIYIWLCNRYIKSSRHFFFFRNKIHIKSIRNTTRIEYFRKKISRILKNYSGYSEYFIYNTAHACLFTYLYKLYNNFTILKNTRLNSTLTQSTLVLKYSTYLLRKAPQTAALKIVQHYYCAYIRQNALTIHVIQFKPINIRV